MHLIIHVMSKLTKYNIKIYLKFLKLFTHSLTSARKNKYLENEPTTHKFFIHTSLKYTTNKQAKIENFAEKCKQI